MNQVKVLQNQSRNIQESGWKCGLGCRKKWTSKVELAWMRANVLHYLLPLLTPAQPYCYNCIYSLSPTVSGASGDSHARGRTCPNDLTHETEAGDTSVLRAKEGRWIFKGLFPDGINQIGLFSSGEESVKWSKWQASPWASKRGDLF